LIERLEHLGGAGVNTGTIPSKTLREAALTLSGVRSRRSMGVDLSVRPEEMLQALSWRAMDVARNERQALQGRLERQGVHVLHGVASFIDSHTIRIAGTDSVQELAAEKFLIASGHRNSPSSMSMFAIPMKFSSLGLSLKRWSSSGPV
jgi:NAD(P) transhydrogenase